MTKADLLKGLRKAYSCDEEIQLAIQKIKSNKAAYIETDNSLIIYHATFNHDGELGLFVELAISTDMNCTDLDNLTTDMAKVAKAEFVKFKTRRKAMVKQAKRHGFHVSVRHQNIYTLVKEVKHG
ncbi:hypothetical protein [Catenovulum sediminis]|uniref:DUF1398 domain-containing protein n=1 Tax=Catenovulum sediminis TaxID=1740262 RepID=A0ABV1RHX0_9ALTE